MTPPAPKPDATSETRLGQERADLAHALDDLVNAGGYGASVVGALDRYVDERVRRHLAAHPRAQGGAEGAMRDAVEWLLDFATFGPPPEPDRTHACGPEGNCDGDCMDRAHFAMRRADVRKAMGMRAYARTDFAPPSGEAVEQRGKETEDGDEHRAVENETGSGRDGVRSDRDSAEHPRDHREVRTGAESPGQRRDAPVRRDGEGAQAAVAPAPASEGSEGPDVAARIGRLGIYVDSWRKWKRSATPSAWSREEIGLDDALAAMVECGVAAADLASRPHAAESALASERAEVERLRIDVVTLQDEYRCERAARERAEHRVAELEAISHADNGETWADECETARRDRDKARTELDAATARVAELEAELYDAKNDARDADDQKDEAASELAAATARHEAEVERMRGAVDWQDVADLIAYARETEATIDTPHVKSLIGSMRNRLSKLIEAVPAALSPTETTAGGATSASPLCGSCPHQPHVGICGASSCVCGAEASPATAAVAPLRRGLKPPCAKCGRSYIDSVHEQRITEVRPPECAYADPRDMPAPPPSEKPEAGR